MIIGGREKGAKDGRAFDVVNPATSQVICSVPDASAEDVEEAVRIAHDGKAAWKDTPLYKRVEILQRFTGLVERDRAELRKTMVDEIGKPVGACDGEISSCINIFKAYCEKARVYATETLPLNTEPGNDGDILFTVREPLGVVVCIIPFNYPVELYAHKVAPALVAGNVVIAKPSSDTPISAVHLTRLLHEAGVPVEALQVLTGNGARIGGQLSSHDKIDAVSLTGSTEAGIQTALNGAKNLTKIYLELGGNDPLIVFDDADIDRAVSESLLGRASNSGQTCCATKRFIVQNSIADDFTGKLVEALRGVKVGDPNDPEVGIGPLVSEKAAINVEKDILHTIGQGAKCVLGGNRFNTTFIEATVLAGVTPEMDIANALEIFGPVFPIIGFDTIDEAIRIANQIPYGLSSGVMTKDTGKALKVAMAIEAGTCVINGCGNYRTAYHAFGGYKMTGYGREGCGYTLDEFTQIKTVVLKQMR
ncbi:MAG: aldehyde dehydrogenase family protein [Clostridiales Family XIII bacterium]|nr:aldehyde dehydrogenase family protein [Clostridiales Family XIII bacterium]